MTTTNTTRNQAKSGRKPKYPDYISLEVLDLVIKSGADPLEMITQMKKALMERVLEAELNHHLERSHGSTTIAMVTAARMC
jgi:hypothetical protein